MKTVKYYKLSFLDKKQNELKSITIAADSITTAKNHAKDLFNESLINDLHKIKVRLL